MRFVFFIFTFSSHFTSQTSNEKAAFLFVAHQPHEIRITPSFSPTFFKGYKNLHQFSTLTTLPNA